MAPFKLNAKIYTKRRIVFGRPKQPVAAPGVRPKAGETWRVLGPKGTVFSQHLFEISSVRPFVPPDLKILPLLPGKTPGFLCLAYYGPGSSVEYHELTVMSAVVAYRKTLGLWVSHIYVDSEESIQAGREVFGLPKQMARFEWEGGSPGTARIFQDDQRIITIGYGRPGFSLKAPVFGRALSVIEGNVIASSHRLWAPYGFAAVNIDLPPASPLAELRFSRPMLRLVGGVTSGFMGLGQRVLGSLSKNS